MAAGRGGRVTGSPAVGTARAARLKARHAATCPPARSALRRSARSRPAAAIAPQGRRRHRVWDEERAQLRRVHRREWRRAHADPPHGKRRSSSTPRRARASQLTREGRMRLDRDGCRGPGRGPRCRLRSVREKKCPGRSRDGRIQSSRPPVARRRRSHPPPERPRAAPPAWTRGARVSSAGSTNRAGLAFPPARALRCARPAPHQARRPRLPRAAT